MTFLVKPSKRHFWYIRKKRAGNGDEILQKLEDYLKGNYDEPVEILCGFWKDQANIFTYQELRLAVIEGLLDKKTYEKWTQDYSLLVKNRLQPMWEKAIAAGSKSQPLINGLSGFSFNVHASAVSNWISKRGAEFVTASTQEQKDAIRALLEHSVREQYSVDGLARLIRPCVGLTVPQAKANLKYYNNIVKTLKEEHPRMKPERIEQKAREAAAKYAEKQHRQRAMNIAQTEMATAYNKGADESIRQAQAQKLIGKVIKRWCTSGDDAVCDACRALEGIEISMDEGFKVKGGFKSGDNLTPPAHPRCACAVEYIEIESRNTGLLLGASDASINPENMMHELGEIDLEKVDEALDYYNELIRNRENENVVIIDKEGNLYYAEGSTSNVDISNVNLVGAFVTHNHPISNGILSFGKDDFEFLKENPFVKKLMAVNEEYDYSVTVLSDMTMLSYNTYYIKAMERITDPLSETEDLQHLVFEILHEEGYVHYVRKSLH